MLLLQHTYVAIATLAAGRQPEKHSNRLPSSPRSTSAAWVRDQKINMGLCILGRLPWIRIAVLEIHRNDPDVPFSHRAISDKMYLKKYLFPGVCDEPIERW
jgi:hypothetical protein